MTKVRSRDKMKKTTFPLSVNLWVLNLAWVDLREDVQNGNACAVTDFFFDIKTHDFQ